MILLTMTMTMTMMVHRVYAAWRCRLNETLESAQVISSHSNVSVSNISSHSNVYAKISIALSLQKCAFQAMLTIHPLQWNRYRNDLKLNQWWSMWRRQLLILQLQVMWTSDLKQHSRTLLQHSRTLFSHKDSLWWIQWGWVNSTASLQTLTLSQGLWAGGPGNIVLPILCHFQNIVIAFFWKYHTIFNLWSIGLF